MLLLRISAGRLVRPARLRLPACVQLRMASRPKPDEPTWLLAVSLELHPEGMWLAGWLCSGRGLDAASLAGWLGGASLGARPAPAGGCLAPIGRAQLATQ